MSLDDVIKRFRLISQLEPDLISKWAFLCKESIKYIESRMISGVDVQSNSMRLASGAAAYAYYRYCLISSTESISSFKAGDVQISVNEKVVEQSRIMWLNEKNSLWDLLDFQNDDHDSFLFKRMSI